MWMDVDVALSGVPVNVAQLIDDTDFKAIEAAVVFNQAGLVLVWNFVTTAGVYTQTAVTPTDTAGVYDWVNKGNGYYSLEIPASGGVSINNDAEGLGWFSGIADGILPWRGPTIGFRAAPLNDALIDGGDVLDVNVTTQANLALTAQQKLDVNAEADAAHVTYDAPTSAEMDTAHALLATVAKQDVIDGIVDAILLDTAVIGALGAGLTGIPWNAAWDADAQSEAADALTAFFTSAAQLVDDVWDEPLTGGTHNVTGSAGRRLRQIQENLGYEGGAVWIDTVNGTAGTENFEHGTVDNPVSNIADANTLAASLGLSRFRVAPGSSITFAAAQQAQQFEGSSWTLALGGQDIANTSIIGANVTGIATGTGTQYIFECNIGAATWPADTHIIACGIMGTQTLPAGDVFYADCHSAIAGSGAPIFDFGAGVGVTDFNVRNYSGGLDIRNMGQTGADVATIEGRGQVIINANSTGGAMEIRGLFSLTDNGNVTVTDDARYNVSQDVATVGGAVMRGTDSGATAASLSTHDTDLKARLPASLVGGRIDASVGAMASNVLTAAALAADAATEIATAMWASGTRTLTAIGTGVIDATARNEIADALLKRDWTAVTGEAARSVLNALRAIRNRVAESGGTLTVYEEDDSTTAWTAAVTRNAAAENITESDPT